MEFGSQEFNALCTDGDVDCSGEDDNTNDSRGDVGLGNKSLS
jgi:hypothetical protein